MKQKNINRNVKKMRTRHMPVKVIENKRAYSRKKPDIDYDEEFNGGYKVYSELPEIPEEVDTSTPTIPNRKEWETLEEYEKRLSDLIIDKLTRYFINEKTGTDTDG